MYIIHRLHHFSVKFLVFAVSILIVLTTATAHTRKNSAPSEATPLHDNRQKSKKIANYVSNSKQERHLERNLHSTRKFLTKRKLQKAVNEYCDNPNGWVSNPLYATYGLIEDWDVSLITDMSYLFSLKNTCNPDIGNWNVSGVTNFGSMFYNARAFNQDIGSWDVSNSVYFDYMFIYAEAFNQDISSWDVSNGKDFRWMFYYADAFNQDIGSWDVSKNVNFSYMFYYAYAFNQDIGSWDVSKGKDFMAMFSNADAFNQDIGSWDVSNGTNFEGMFYYADGFNQDISSWDVSNGVNFDTMFYFASEFRQNLCSWPKSPNSTSVLFCTGSYCGGDCSPTFQPSSAPSSEIPSFSVVPTSVPSLLPTIDLCNVVDVVGQTIFLPGADACWRVQLGKFGTLEADFTDSSCSKDESEWQSTGGIFSYFSFVNSIDDSVGFTSDGGQGRPPSKGWSGTFQFKEDINLKKPSLQLLSWDPPTTEFAVLVTIKTCSPDAICPTAKADI